MSHDRSRKHKWAFAPRFRRNAFAWKSQPAIKRVKEAVAEVKKIARKDPDLAAEGAVLFLEKVSPALEQVDGSSGAIGTAVDNAIRALAPIISQAPADAKTRDGWLERLWKAHEADEMPYIESLTDYWGDLCASNEVASTWADRLMGMTRMAFSPDRNVRGYFHGTSACLSAPFRAGRYAEIVDLLDVDTIWAYKQWAVQALAALGEKAEAIRYAEGCRSSWENNRQIDAICENVLLSSGLAEEAYKRYGLTANRAGTHLAWFRAVMRKYADKTAAQVLADLVAITPGDEGKWFAAAKDAGLYEEAIELARTSPCDPRTLTRAARDFGEKNPAFALEAGLAALHWLVEGYGYEITSVDVSAAHAYTLKAAETTGALGETRRYIRQLVKADAPGAQFVNEILERDLGFDRNTGKEEPCDHGRSFTWAGLPAQGRPPLSSPCCAHTTDRYS